MILIDDTKTKSFDSNYCVLICESKNSEYYVYSYTDTIKNIDIKEDHRGFYMVRFLVQKFL